MNNTLRWTSLLMCAAFTVGAAAADSDMTDSEYLHQAASGAVDVTAGLGQAPGNLILISSIPAGVSAASMSVQGTGSKLNLTLVPVVAAVEYGLSSAFAVGAELAYGTGNLSIGNCPDGSSCPSHTVTGLYDPILYLKGRASAGPGTLLYGAVAQMGFDNAKVSSSGDTNLASGGTTISPFVAYQMSAGPGIWGARLKYDIFKTYSLTVNDKAGSRTKEVGGNSLSIDAFYEAPVGFVTLGGSVFFVGSTSSKTEVDRDTLISNNTGNNIFGAEFYAPFNISPVTLLPNISYSHTSYTSAQSPVSSATIYQVGLAARMTF